MPGSANQASRRRRQALSLTVSTSDTLERAAQLMHQYRESHVVVVDPASNAAVGVVSTLDVADALAETTIGER